MSCLITRTKDAAAREALIKMKAQIKPANRDLFYDMEFFLGVDYYTLVSGSLQVLI